PASPWATASVPRSNGGTSYTPSGPFQTTAAAASQVCRKRSTVIGPTSSTFMSDGTASTATVRLATPALASGATTASSGSTRVPPSCPEDASSERATSS